MYHRSSLISFLPHVTISGQFLSCHIPDSYIPVLSTNPFKSISILATPCVPFSVSCLTSSIETETVFLYVNLQTLFSPFNIPDTLHPSHYLDKPFRVSFYLHKTSSTLLSSFSNNHFYSFYYRLQPPSPLSPWRFGTFLITEKKKPKIS